LIFIIQVDIRSIHYNMIKLKDIQDQIYLHNESCNKKKLKLPNKISKTNVTEFLDSLFSKWVE
jgi:hypothetical protein